jgi:threonylcarbamoyladenosine tRNA methylthiotransferase MtaB
VPDTPARPTARPLAGPRGPLVALRTLGCKVNRSESDALADELTAAGVALTSDEAAAAVIVINSCTVTGEADAKTRKAVRHALAAPGAPTVVVTGCLAVLNADVLRGLGSRVIVESEKTLVAAVVLRALNGVGGGGVRREILQGGGAAKRRGVPARSLDRAEGIPDAGGLSGVPKRRTRATVKVQDGCDHRCSYCIVPDARGPARSVPAADVVARVAALASGDTAEVVLTGVNIGRYADAAGGACDLAALVQAVAATGIRRIRISSIEPLDLTPRLLDVLASLPAVMPHMHVPLQSGCDATLRAMRRGYHTREFADALARARATLPGLAVTTDVIAGFPGETDAHFSETLSFVEECAFTRLHVFRYSRRAGTPAATMPAPVPPRTIAARATALRALGDRLAVSYAASRLGGEADVLVEKVAGRTAEGTSGDYLRVRVRVPAGERMPTVGEVVPATLTAADGATVLAEPSAPRPRPRV